MSQNSAAPGTPQTATKAYVSAAVSFLITFGAYYIGDSEAFTKKEIVEALLLAAIGSGLAGGSTWAVKNTAIRR